MSQEAKTFYLKMPKGDVDNVERFLRLSPKMYYTGINTRVTPKPGRPWRQKDVNHHLT